MKSRAVGLALLLLPGTILAQSLPEEWTDQDIGSVGIGGSSTYDSNSDVFTVQGSGADIWGQYDGFHFLSTALTGDGQLTARIVSQQDTHQWAKAGLMLRQSTDIGSPFAAFLETPENGLNFFDRTSEWNYATIDYLYNTSYPQWLRMTRAGDYLLSSISTDGLAWSISTATLQPLGTNALAGMAVNSLNNSVCSAAVFDNVSFLTNGYDAFGALPSPWTLQTLGSANQGTSAYRDDNTWLVTGNGGDLYGTSDGGSFMNRAWQGDGEFTTRVLSVENSHGWAKGALMVRETLDADAREVYLSVSPNGTLIFVTRATPSSQTQVITSGPASFPDWLKLQRVGNQFYASQSGDGTNWNFVGQVYLPMQGGVNVGLGSCSIVGNQSSTAIFDQFTSIGLNGNGYSESDGSDTFLYGNDPTVTNFDSFQVFETLAGSNAVIATGLWQVDDLTGYIINESGRGSLNFNIQLPTAGMDAVQMSLDLRQGSPDGPFPLRILVDGNPVGALAPNLSPGQPVTTGILLPWLSAGAHTVQVLIDNPNLGRNLIVRSLSVAQPTGSDSNGNGVPDWVDSLVASRNGINPGGTVSFTSPAFIEGPGIASYITSPDASNGLTIQPAPNDGWYANVNLPTNGTSKTVTLNFENGALQQTRTLSWGALNIASTNQITIRVGDALRLTAFAGAQPTNNPVALSINGTLVSNTTEDSPVVQSFTNAGVSTVSASYQNASGATVQKSITVKVVGAQFAGSPVAVTTVWRDWNNPGISMDTPLDFDQGIQFTRSGSYPGSDIQFAVPDLKTRYIAARLSPGGPIIASTAVRAEDVYTANQTSIQEIATYADGSRLVAMTIAVNNLQADTPITDLIFVGGVVFQDTGLSIKTFAASDFNDQGEVTVYFIQAPGTVTSTCNAVLVFQGGYFLGSPH